MIYPGTSSFSRVPAQGTGRWLWLFSCLLIFPVVGFAQDCITVGGSPASGDLQVTLAADKATVRTVSTAEDPYSNFITYTIDIYNNSNSPMANIDFEGQLFDGNAEALPADFFDSYEISHNFQNASFALEQNPMKITGDVSLEAQQRGELTVKVRLKEVPPRNTLTGRVNVFATGAIDANMNNNWETVETVVQAEGKDIMIIKSTEDACLDPSYGNIITVSVTNTGTEAVNFDTEGIYVEEEVFSSANHNIEIIDYGAYGEFGVNVSQNQKNITASKTSTNSEVGETLEPGETISFSYRLRDFDEVYNKAVTVSELSGGEVTTENNSDSLLLVEQPNAPNIEGEVFYLQGEQTDFLTATGDDGNDLNWYYTDEEQGRAYPRIKPSTATAGTTTYFVSQSNHGCESELVEVQVTVVAPEPGSLDGDKEFCKNMSSGIIGSTDSGMEVVPGGFTISYLWQSSDPDTDDWEDIQNADTETYSPGSMSNTLSFRRFTVLTRGEGEDKKCIMSAPTESITVNVKPCAVTTNPMMPSRASSPPAL